MTTRIYFSIIGCRGESVNAPAYAVMTENDSRTKADAIVESIARKNHRQVITLRSDGYAMPGHIPHWQCTIGTPCRGGGFTPTSELWFAVY